MGLESRDAGEALSDDFKGEESVRCWMSISVSARHLGWEGENVLRPGRIVEAGKLFLTLFKSSISIAKHNHEKLLVHIIAQLHAYSSTLSGLENILMQNHQ
jgi:hypothetical protein